MKNKLLLSVFLLLPVFIFCQQIIELPNINNSPIRWEGEAREFFYSEWKTEVVTNVSSASMEVFVPDASIANGSSVIVAPGGGLFALSIENEGNRVAKWLNDKGFVAFVLRYRLFPTANDGIKEMPEDIMELAEMVKPVLPLAIEDGKNAVAYIRENAKRWDIDPEKIGFMGFSAGGAVTMGVTLNAEDTNRPNFIVPVYAWMTVVGDYEVPEETPPMLIICASDDPLILGPSNVELYSRWVDEGGHAELHMYSKGGHGFGMEQQGLPSDNWISRFYEWALAEEFISSRIPQ